MRSMLEGGPSESRCRAVGNIASAAARRVAIACRRCDAGAWRRTAVGDPREQIGTPTEANATERTHLTRTRGLAAQCPSRTRRRPQVAKARAKSAAPANDPDTKHVAVAGGVTRPARPLPRSAVTAIRSKHAARQLHRLVRPGTRARDNHRRRSSGCRLRRRRSRSRPRLQRQRHPAQIQSRKPHHPTDDARVVTSDAASLDQTSSKPGVAPQLPVQAGTASHGQQRDPTVDGGGQWQRVWRGRASSERATPQHSAATNQGQQRPAESAAIRRIANAVVNSRPTAAGPPKDLLPLSRSAASWPLLPKQRRLVRRRNRNPT